MIQPSREERMERKRRAVDGIIKRKLNNERIIMGEVMQEAGYPESSKPSDIVRTKEFTEVLTEAGLTKEIFANYLKFDLDSKPGNRLGEMKLFADVLQVTKQTVDLNVSSSEDAMSKIEEVLNSTKE